MSTYVMSDLHGQYDLYKKMLKKIHFSDEDMLYILGDILDRGPHPIRIILDLLERFNVDVIVGNHCVVAMDCLRNFMLKEITEENIEDINVCMLEKVQDWYKNGGIKTQEELSRYDRETIQEVISFIGDFSLYEDIEVGGKRFILVHAGLDNFRVDKPLWEYSLDELVWKRPTYEQVYFEDAYVVSGHTPTMYIEGNSNPGYIYHKNNNIVIDCGCYLPEGRLACLRLDDMKEFYVENGR